MAHVRFCTHFSKVKIRGVHSRAFDKFGYVNGEKTLWITVSEYC
jgi:hypothetical protein